MIVVKPRRLRPGRKPVCLFFGESPGQDEAREGFAFVGRSGRLIEDLINVELPDWSVVLDNVCPEWLDRKKPDMAKLREWEDYRLKRIRQVRPDVVCLLGAIATKAFDIPGTALVNAGRVSRIDGVHPYVVAAIHPAYILRNLGEITIYKKVFQAIRMGISRLDDEAAGCSPGEFTSWLRKHEKSLVCFDLETSTLRPTTGIILCASVCGPNLKPLWVPLFHHECWQEDRTDLLRTIVEWWCKGPRLCHNAKFEIAWMHQSARNLGMEPKDPPVIVDTMVGGWLLNENEPKNLNHHVVNVLHKAPYWLELPEKGTYADVPLRILGPYCANDTKHTYMLHKIQQRKLTPRMKRVQTDLFGRLAPVLSRMEHNGIHVDRKLLEGVGRKLERKAARLTKKLNKHFPGLNPSSPKQVRELCLYELGLRPAGWTSKGEASFDDNAIEKLVDQEPRLQDLVDARKATSVVRRIVNPWLNKHLNPETGCIHTSFSLCGAVTGRLTSSDPNLQNVDREGPQRTAMVSRFKNGVILQADYAQHELRILAAETNDERFLEVFRKKGDPHQMTCDDITAQGVECDRPKAKNINFAVVFDISPQGLWMKYKIPQSLGHKLIRAWYEAHPKTAKMHERIDRELIRRGYTENMFGLRRRVGDPRDGHSRRQAYNYPIQSPAVLICFVALIDVDQWLRSNRMRSLVVHQVHDSIVIDCHPKEVRKVARAVRKIMLNVRLKPYLTRKIVLPLGVDIKEGKHF